jgi:superfamily II DNA or RNA helicase
MPGENASRVTVTELVTVERRLDLASLEAATVTLTQREATGLALPQHPIDVACRFAGEPFYARWRAKERVLEGEVLAEHMQLHGQASGLLRLALVKGVIEMQIVAPGGTTSRTRPLFDPVPARSARISAKAISPNVAATRGRQKATRQLREDRYRLRERGEYEWTGSVGVHRGQRDALVKNIEAAGWDDAEVFDLRVRGETLAAVSDFGELLAVDQAHVDHMPHQEATARRVLSRMRGRAVLADEVGLGKTIEAGLIMKELMLRGMAARVLVLTPASLREQWQEELLSKFDEEFRVVTSSYEGFEGDRLICSIHLARQNIKELTRTRWDLVIWDEAHKGAGGPATKKLWRTIDSRYLLFLTATPVQNSLLELHNLIELLRPGTFRSEKDFRRRFLVDGDARRPRNPADLRRLVADVMVRSTREQAGLDDVRRFPLDVPVDLDQRERHLYHLCTDGLRTVIAGAPNSHLLARHLAHRLTGSPRSLALTARKMAASQDDPRARSFLEELAELGLDLGVSTRQTKLLEIVTNWTKDPTKGQAIVFTQHSDTLDDLLRILEIQGIGAVAYHGRLSPQARQRAIRDFREGVPLMVSTDAGAEGLNLQFANCVVNYDLPWNPMKIEQRIGRVHRVTQTRDVYVANLYARGTIDEHVYRILHDKLRMFELLFGQVTTILGELEDAGRNLTFEGVVLDALLAGDDAEMNKRLNDLGAKVDSAWQATQRMVQDEGGLNVWFDRSHRDELKSQASELRPDMKQTTRRRRRDVYRFARSYLDSQGATIEFDQAPDNEGRGAFISATLPPRLAVKLDGREEVHLAFDGSSLELHREAELCAAGTELFEEMVLAIAERGDLMAHATRSAAGGTCAHPPQSAARVRVASHTRPDRMG